MCYSVCVCASPHSPLLLRIILAETPLALPSLGDVAVVFSSELTSVPCCFSRSVSVLVKRQQQTIHPIKATHTLNSDLFLNFQAYAIGE